VSDVLPARRATRQRLGIGIGIILLGSLLHLASFDLWVFGSPWPLPLLWAACGWAGLGAQVGSAAILFVLGLWFDLLTGARLGTWAVISLSTYMLTLVSARLIGSGESAPILNCAVSGLLMMCAMTIVSLMQATPISLIPMLIPILTTIALYPFIAKWFELFEDEA
jgi:hypothetical protein